MTRCAWFAVFVACNGGQDPGHPVRDDRGDADADADADSDADADTDTDSDADTDTSPNAQPNLLLVLVDDIGIDKLTGWQGDMPGYTPTPGEVPVTPAIDTLVAGGTRFPNMWSNPLCSPTRSTILTGRFGYRTGIGAIVGETAGLPTPPLPMGETTLPEALGTPSGGLYDTGLIGKWHLGERGLDVDLDDDPLDWETLGPRDVVPPPNAQGFRVYDGNVRGGLADYWNWTRVVATDFGTLAGDEHAEVTTETAYATEVQGTAAADYVATAPEPWFAMVAFNAAHRQSGGLTDGHFSQGCSTITSGTTDREIYRAMIECMDLELDRILSALESSGRLDDTVILFTSDNGPEPDIADVGFPHAALSKGSLYEVGVRVPLVVAHGKHLDGTPYGTTYTGRAWEPGDLVQPGQTSQALVQSVDVYDTILELAGSAPEANDSTSFADALADPTVPGSRTAMYAEVFDDEDLDGVYDGGATIRRGDFKLTVVQVDDGTAVPCQWSRLFDVVSDPEEAIDLVNNPAYAGDLAALRGIIDATITTFEGPPSYQTHWMWSSAENPGPAATCPREPYHP